MRQLLTEIGLPNKDDQYARIKVAKKKPRTKQIKANIVGQKGKVVNIVTSNTLSTTSFTSNPALISPITFPLKGDSERFIALAHNPVFHTPTKHIDNQQYYSICDKVTSKKINL